MNKLTKKQTEELNFVAALPDDAIDTSDIPEQTNWNNARVGRFYLADRGNIEVDGDILEWFKAKSSRHYQQLINKALRDYIQRPPRQ
jgi:uncharacterized protein (DUF4415 family)